MRGWLCAAEATIDVTRFRDKVWRADLYGSALRSTWTLRAGMRRVQGYAFRTMETWSSPRERMASTLAGLIPAAASCALIAMPAALLPFKNAAAADASAFAALFTEARSAPVKPAVRVERLTTRNSPNASLASMSSLSSSTSVGAAVIAVSAASSAVWVLNAATRLAARTDM